MSYRHITLKQEDSANSILPNKPGFHVHISSSVTSLDPPPTHVDIVMRMD